MSSSQSKLMLQLNKQKKITEKVSFSEEKLQDLYSTVSKIQPKNLMLVQFLTLIIQKNLVKNSFKISTFAQMYEQIKGKKLQQQHNNFNKTNAGEKQQQKFNKKKFVKLLKDVSKLLYPGDPKAFQSTLYLKLIMPDSQQNRLRVDQNLKKYLTQDVIATLSKYHKEFQILFEAFMPQNYNLKLQFSWNEIRLLQKRLPILCLLRILFQAQVCPQVLSQIQFLQIVSKMIPPSNANHKQAMFYYSQTFNNYMRQYIYLDQIKLIEGDIGLTFLEFQMLFIRLSTQFCKENKQQFSKYIDKFMAQLGISQIIKQKKQNNLQSKMTKLQSTVFTYLKENTSKFLINNPNKPNIKKQSLIKKQRKQFNDLIDEPNQWNLKSTEQNSILKLQHQSLLVTKDDLIKIKRNLDDQLGPIPEKPVIDKENQGYFNVNQKFIVIGQQPPKIQDKNKPAAKANPKDKQQDPFLGFKPQEQNDQSQKPTVLINRKKKLRINTQYPIILNQVFYPTNFKDNNLFKLKQQQQIYLETSYIHLGQRLYEEAYSNFQKARHLYNNQKNLKTQKKNIAAQFYFAVFQAQIFESAGKDQAALVYYYAAKEICYNLITTQSSAKAFSYMGLSSALYHLQQYEYSLRCLLKAKQIYGQNLETQSIQNAILLNNMASCYMMINRNQQAAKYYNISHQILDLKAGRFDQRTLVVQRNIAKNKKAYIQQMPSFKTMWKTYVQKNNNLTAAKGAVKKAK